MSSSDLGLDVYRVDTYSAESPPSTRTCDEVLRFIRTHEGEGTLNAVLFERQGTEVSAGDLPYYRFLITEDPTATTQVCVDESQTVRGALIVHVQEELDDAYLERGEEVCFEQISSIPDNCVIAVEDEVKRTLSPGEREAYEDATEISVLSFPKKGDPAGMLIGKTLLQALSNDSGYRCAVLPSESQVFLDNGFKVLGSESGHKVQIPDNAPYRPPSGEIDVVFLFKDKSQTS